MEFSLCIWYVFKGIWSSFANLVDRFLEQLGSGPERPGTEATPMLGAQAWAAVLCDVMNGEGPCQPRGHTCASH